MPFWGWSKTAASNANSDPTINMAEGMPPAQLNDGVRAVMARAAEFRDDTSGLLLTAGTSTAYTVTTNQGLAATPNDGQLLVVTLHTANGTNATLAADSGTPFALQAFPGTPLSPNILLAGVPCALKFKASASAWIPFGSAFAGALTTLLPNSGLANAPAWTLKGNNTSASATPQDIAGGAITNVTPSATDSILGFNGTTGAIQRCTAAALSSARALTTTQRFTSGSGTYNIPAGAVMVRIRMIGGGGGGGALNANAGSNGGSTTFGPGWSVGGGIGGPTGAGAGGAGGTGGSNSTGNLVTRSDGGKGTGVGNGAGASDMAGGCGGNGPFGGGGGGGPTTTAGTAAALFTGAGGGGAGGSAGANTGGAGGGAGEYVEFWMSASQIGGGQSYAVGAAGAGGAAGTVAGGAGSAGLIIVEEFY